MTDPEKAEHTIEEGKGRGLERKKEGMGLEPRQFVSFNKEKALSYLASSPNSITHVCKQLGIDRTTWYWHISTDPDFAIRVQEIKEACCDALEQNMFELGSKPQFQTFNDRIAYLRAHRPHLYNPTKKIIVEGYSMNGKEKAARLGAIETVIDAEVVKTYTTRKERIETKRQEQLGGGKGQAGNEAGGGG